MLLLLRKLLPIQGKISLPKKPIFNRKYRTVLVLTAEHLVHVIEIRKKCFCCCNDDMHVSPITARAVRVSARDYRDQTRFACRFLSALRTSQTGSAMLIDRPRHDVTQYTFSAAQCGGFDDAHLIQFTCSIIMPQLSATDCPNDVKSNTI